MKNLIVIPVFLLMNFLLAEDIPFLILDLNTESVLGSTKAGKFHTSKNTYVKLKQSIPNDTFVVYDETQIKEKEIQLKTLKNTDDYCRDYFKVTTSSKLNSGVAVSTKINWDLTPRAIKPLAKNSKIYNEVVKNILISKGFKDPKVSIKQIYSADLDNDKQNEIVIVGEHYKKIIEEDGARRSSSHPGDYSFIVVRNVYQGKVNNILLGGSFNVSSIDSAESRVIPDTYELTSILDLNGDGIMEIIVYSYYYEGSFTSVYQFFNLKAKCVLGSGCGS